MAVATVRDPEAVVEGVLAWLGADPATVAEVERPSDGWSGETVLLRFGDQRQDLAVRLPPLGEGLFPDDDLHRQARAQHAAAEAGLPVPAPATVVDDVRWVGSPFLAMPLVEGHVPGEVPAFDPWVESLDPALQRSLHEQVADLLADLHAVDPARADLPRRSVTDELAWWGEYLAWSGAGDAVPALTRALDGCRATAPLQDPAPAVLWGDVRLGNVVFDDGARPLAVLDWEMATVGAPEHDLAWWWALEALQDELVGGRAEGFAPIGDLRARYEARAGRTLPDLDWYEAFALLRSTAILTRIGLLQLEAGESPLLTLDDNPVLEHLRRRVDALG